MGYSVFVAESEYQLQQADLIVFPGVGNFTAAMNKIEESHLLNGLNEHVLIKMKPIVGICLGMQLFSKESEEGNVRGLGWIDGYTKKFNFKWNDKLKVPHMGWSEVNWSDKSPISAARGARYYFTHSYYVACSDPANILCSAYYGHPFAAGLLHQNIAGFQFHPEKSHQQGMDVLRLIIEYFRRQS